MRSDAIGAVAAIVLLAAILANHISTPAARAETANDQPAKQHQTILERETRPEGVFGRASCLTAIL